MNDLAQTWCLSSTRRDTLDVHLLGVVDYDSARFLQDRLVYEIAGRDDRYGGMLLCEHPPLITIGRNGTRSQVRVDSAELSARLIDVRWVSRGGGALVHAPGQLALYPIVPLQRLGLDLQAYRRVLEESVVEACAELRIPAERDRQVPGVRCRIGRFAHTAAAVRSWISLYGIYVDVHTPPEFLDLVESDPGQRRAASLAAQRVGQIGMSSIREALMRHVAERLGYSSFHLYTGHPLLQRTRRRVYQGTSANAG